MLAVLVWALATLYFSIYFSEFLLLGHLYGFARVRSEHLHFTATPKGHDWIVSNGDHVGVSGTSWHFLVSLGLWLALFFATFWIIYYFLPKRKDTNAA